MSMNQLKAFPLVVTLCACAAEPPDHRTEIGGLDTESSMGFSARDVTGLAHYDGSLRWVGSADGYALSPEAGQSDVSVDIRLVEGRVFEVGQCGEEHIGNVDCRTYLEAPIQLSISTTDGALSEQATGVLKAYGPQEWTISIGHHEIAGTFTVEMAQPSEVHYWYMAEYHGGQVAGYFGGTVSSTGTAGGFVAAEWTADPYAVAD
jgi:hypothetical protein